MIVRLVYSKIKRVLSIIPSNYICIFVLLINNDLLVMECNISQMQAIISELEHLDFSTINPEDIITIIQKLHNMPILSATHILHSETNIIRARPVSAYDEVEKIQDISYVPHRKNTSYQRASMPNNTMYYGIIYEPNKIQQTVSCLMECCPCFRETAKDGSCYAVIGYWKVIQDVELFSIFNPLSQINKSPSTRLFADKFEECIKLAQTKVSHSDAICFNNYLHNQFTRMASSESDYWVSSLIAKYILTSDAYDGIVYESNQSQDPKLSDSLCVAIKPQSVDTKLEFIGATDYEISIRDGVSSVRSIKEHVF